MKNVLFLSAYCAAYKGNFIPSLEYLEDAYNGGRCIYVFPQSAKQVAWMFAFQKKHSVYFLPDPFFGKKTSLDLLKRLNTLLKKEDIHVVHTHFLTYNYSLFLAKYTFARNIKFIAHVHNQFVIPHTKSASIKKFVMEQTYDTLIGVSGSVAEGLKSQLNHNNITYINNAIYFPRLEHYEKICLRNNDSQKVVMMAGWPALVKGVDIAAKAILLLRNEGHDIKLCIMQSGDTGQTKKCIIAAINDCPEWIEILPPREDVATYYNAVDVFLSSSRIEAFSYCLVEAAYCAPSLISSDIPGPGDLQIPGLLLFPKEDIYSLKNILETTLLNSKDKNVDRKDKVQRLYGLKEWAAKVILQYV